MFTLIFIKFSEGYRCQLWHYNSSISICLLLLVWCLSMAPLPVLFQEIYYKYFLLAMSISLCIVNIIFILCFVNLLKACRRRNYDSREHFIFSSIITKQKRDRQRKKIIRITMGLMISFSLCSYPYMVYFATLYLDISNKMEITLIEKVMLLSVLIKCMCDGIIYIFFNRVPTQTIESKLHINVQPQYLISKYTVIRKHLIVLNMISNESLVFVN